MLELDLKRKVLKAIKKQFPKAWVWKISDRFYSGIPDLFIIHNGVHIFIELKRPGEKPTKIQIYTMNKINEAGGFALCVSSVGTAMQAIKILNGKGGDYIGINDNRI